MEQKIEIIDLNDSKYREDQYKYTSHILCSYNNKALVKKEENISRAWAYARARN